MTSLERGQCSRYQALLGGHISSWQNTLGFCNQYNNEAKTLTHLGALETVIFFLAVLHCRGKTS